MKNKRLIIGLLFSVLLLLIPMVNAQGAWGVLDETLNDFGRALLNDRAEAAAERVNPGKIWVPVLVLFFLVFSIIAAALNFVPMFKEEQGRRMRTIIGLVFGLSALQFPWMYVIFPWFGVWIWILLIFIIVALFFIGWGGFSAAWTKGAAEAAGARGEKYRAVEAEKKAETAMAKEERERRIQRTEFRAEDKELRALRREIAREKQLGKPIAEKLEYALGLLSRIKKAGAGRADSPELAHALQKVIDMLAKHIMPTVIESFEDAKDMISRAKKLELLQIAGKIEEKDAEYFKKRFEGRAKAIFRKADYDHFSNPQKGRYNELCNKLAEMSATKASLLAHLKRLEQELYASNQKLVNAVEAIISKLQVGSIDEAMAEINKAAQLDDNHENIISQLYPITVEYDRMNDGELKALRNIHENTVLLKKALEKGVGEIIGGGGISGHPTHS